LQAKDRRFEEAVLPHLDAAYNLARWLMRNETEAQDAVQDACLRALRFVGGLRDEDGRRWLLKIVRNCCYSRLQKTELHQHETEFDDGLHSPEPQQFDPEVLLANLRDGAALRQAIEALPPEFREVIVMRELEGLSYKAIAEIIEAPIGTVMSRLARARRRMQCSLASLRTGEP
jgi:RNA polymerase sigma-70 factor (ECF subfamily)